MKTVLVLLTMIISSAIQQKILGRRQFDESIMNFKCSCKGTWPGQGGVLVAS